MAIGAQEAAELKERLKQEQAVRNAQAAARKNQEEKNAAKKKALKSTTGSKPANSGKSGVAGRSASEVSEQHKAKNAKNKEKQKAHGEALQQAAKVLDFLPRFFRFSGMVVGITHLQRTGQESCV